MDGAPGRMGPSSDLLPGVVAALSFLAMVAFLGLGLVWLAALLAAAVYAGAKLMMPRAAPPPPEPIEAQFRRDMAALRAAADRMKDGEIQARLSAISTSADALLTYFEAHSARSIEGSATVGQFLKLTVAAVDLYLARPALGVPDPGRSRGDLLDLLEQVHTRFAQLQERLNAEDDAAIAGEIKSLSQTLGELDSLWQPIGGERQ